MKNNRKRILSLLLTLVMLVSLMPMVAVAEETGATITAKSNVAEANAVLSITVEDDDEGEKR